MTVGFPRVFPPCFRYPIVLRSRPAVLLDHRSTFGVAGFVETFAERGHITRGRIGLTRLESGFGL